MTTWRQLLVFAVACGATQAVVLLAWIVAADAVKDWLHERRMRRHEKRTEQASRQQRGGRR